MHKLMIDKIRLIKCTTFRSENMQMIRLKSLTGILRLQKLGFPKKKKLKLMNSRILSIGLREAAVLI